MAKLSGYSPGLNPQPVEKPKVAVKPQVRPVSKYVQSQECTCEGCGIFLGLDTDSRKENKILAASVRQGKQWFCTHCRVFFGIGTLAYGVTNGSPDSAREVIAKIQVSGFAMCLISQTFAATTGGTLSVQADDIFPVSKDSVGSHVKKPEVPQKEYTWALYTVRLKIGPETLTVFPHEIAAIDLRTIMHLKQQGDIIEQFVSADDSVGHFTPTPEGRKKIAYAFGL